LYITDIVVIFTAFSIRVSQPSTALHLSVIIFISLHKLLIFCPGYFEDGTIQEACPGCRAVYGVCL